jgi:hypothetical protein
MDEPVLHRRRVRRPADLEEPPGDTPPGDTPPGATSESDVTIGHDTDSRASVAGTAEAGAGVANDADIVGGHRDWGTDSSDAGPVERGLRGLVGGGSSQISPTAALRARDAARPRPEDLARAEAELTIVRRHWVPRD